MNIWRRFLLIELKLFLLGRWDLENYWSLLLLPSVGQVTGWWVGVLLVLLLLLRHSASAEHRMVGYLRRHSDAQVNKAGGQLSGRWIVINDNTLFLEMRAIYIILMGLPYWTRLSRWIPVKVALPNS